LIWNPLQRAVRVLLTAFAFTSFFLGGLILAWLVLPLVALFSRPRQVRILRCQRIVRAAFRLFHGYMRWVRILHFDPRSVHIDLPEGPCVIIANHPTLVDVTALVSVLGEVTVIAKPAMYRSPLVGPLLRLCHHIEGPRDAFTDGPRVLEDGLARLGLGLPVLLFPEGTRSPVGGLGRFKRGALELATRANVPLVCLGLRCTPPVLAREHPWWTTPTRVPRLTVTQLQTYDAPALSSRPSFSIVDELTVGYKRFVAEAVHDTSESR
jgi:1-acyl-sn-glycerol-3-phosphate acyltransferase